MSKQIRQSAQLDSEQEPHCTYSTPFVYNHYETEGVPQSLLYNHCLVINALSEVLKELYHNFKTVRTTEYGESEQQILEELSRIQLDFLTEVKDTYMNKNGLDKPIAEENRAEEESFICPKSGVYQITYSNSNGVSVSYERELMIGDSIIIGYGTSYIEREDIKTCNHKWKKYVGLSESFTYCEVCDTKKGEL